MPIPDGPANVATIIEDLKEYVDQGHSPQEYLLGWDAHPPFCEAIISCNGPYESLIFSRTGVYYIYRDMDGRSAYHVDASSAQVLRELLSPPE